MSQRSPLALDAIKPGYDKDGFAFPHRVFSANEALGHREQVEALFQSNPDAEGYARGLAHLVFPLVDQIAHDDRVIDAAEAVLGPDVLLYGAGFFPKAPQTSSFVSWHQDLTYWGFDGTEEVTVWLALSPVTVDNGCMRFLPGSHLDGIKPHKDTFGADNSLTRGQVLDIDIDESQAVPITLEPGEVSLHHGRMFHASGPNSTDRWRLGLAMQYIAPGMRQIVAREDYAQLVRGEDRFGHFRDLPRPTVDFDSTGISVRERVMAAQSEALYVDAEVRPDSAEYYVAPG